MSNERVSVSPLIVGVLVGVTIGTPALAWAAWTRSYGMGSTANVANIREIVFTDDNLMPLSSLSQVKVYVDNRVSPMDTASARCCTRPSAGIPGFPYYSCDAPVASLAGLGVQTVTLTGTGLAACKSAKGFPYLFVSTTAKDPTQMWVVGVTTSGS